MDMREAEVLQAIRDEIGEAMFDMQSPGTWFRAVKAALPHIGDGRKAEPVYQVWFSKGQWTDVPKKTYDKAAGTDRARILYTHPAPTAQDSRAPESWKLIPIEPTTDALYALAKVDGYLRGDRDMPGLTRWEDYYRAIYAVLPAHYIAEKPGHTEQPLSMMPDKPKPISFKNRRPKKSDFDYKGKVQAWNGRMWDLWDRPAVLEWDEWGLTHWMPTGLQRPQPPEKQ